ncbi:helix-turn-helix domain-containing protein [Geodermatophilus sp. YIM 151500]|uniref:helix-turn-helix domain-containing protein n=1 Tax=Geodermatophilus sp. YIM 151500 TaxID=2984531 RepID=UPI0021E4A752|nr:helix-turn-helix domain-containing protein [Geodermatophilus sp. YIM 151500]MCV2487809.1 helix-turn-helix domain-containing protein [Geodermatophilus sp. YIM 151500]
MRAPGVPVPLRSWMAAVGDIVRAANAAESPDVLLGRVAAGACSLIGFEYCAVLLADSRGERLQLAGSSGLTADYVAMVADDGSPLIHPPGPDLDTPAARAFRENRTVVVPDVLADRRHGRLRVLAEAQGYRSLVAAPLGAATARSGVLVGHSAAPRTFGVADRELVELLADQAAVALESARLRVAQERTIGELSRANDELRRGRALQEWAEQQDHALMGLAMADVGLPGLVSALATTCRASVTVEDAGGDVLARAPEEGYRPPPVASRHRAARWAARAGSAHRCSAMRVPDGRGGRPGAAAVGHPPRPEPEVWVVPLVLDDDLAGRLWVVDPRGGPTSAERQVIERFALVVGLELRHQRRLAEVEARASGDLIGGLLRSEGLEQRTVVARAAALGHDLLRPHVLAVLAVDPPQPVDRWRRSVRAATEREVPALIGPYEDLEVLLAPAEHDPAAGLRRAHENLQRALGSGATVTVAVGPTVTRVADYAVAFRIAAGAARLRRTARVPGGFVDVRSLGLSALLLETGTSEVLRSFARRQLAPLIEHDRGRGGDLLATLRTWLSTGCSTATTASVLVVHPNTVAYRLAKVERLLDRDLRGPDVRLELQLALTVHDLS